jgi:capsular exopolysaccharide synthesis family protein
MPTSGVPQTNSWSGPAPTGLGPVQPAQTPLAKMHQHLRGRYLVTVLIAGFCALAGAGAGILLPRPAYQSVGIIQIDPRIPNAELADRIIPLWQSYVATVVQNFHSEQLLKEAMNNPEWKKYRKDPPEAYLAYWGKNLTVKLVPNAFDITVTYSDDHKDGKVIAPIAVRSLITAYSDLHGDEQKRELVEKRNRQEMRKQTLEQKIAEAEIQINQFLHTDGEDLQKVFDSKFATYSELQKDVRHLESDLTQSLNEIEQARAQQSTTPYTIEDFARVDASMAEMYHIRTTLELEVQKLMAQLGPNHRAVIAARKELEIRNEAMKNYRDVLESKYFIKTKIDGSGSNLVKRDLSVEIAALSRAKAQRDELKRDLDDLSTRIHKVSFQRAEKLRFEEDRRRTQLKIDELTTEIDMANNFRIVDPGSMASISSDKRIAFGALGFLGGAGIPVGLMLLASLMNPRYRYSDETTGQIAAGLTLLGILPDLPDRLSDPEQASIAAHCVHQIRTMLQINNGTDERRVFAITSAAPGDGKTSLTLALGLSYAACGSRTLLIDCDLVGSGLSTRMNVSVPDGVLEAIAHRSLLEYVQTTDIADVSILPVGSGQHLHASTLSPAALRRLIEEAKKHFDTILIDTGPVLGSIEASLVAAAADAVVLTVSRGQQRPLVEKTIQHLKNIKANLAGVVFNRAQTSDFDSSISGLSLRSVGSGNGHHHTRMGPVARAVQSAFQPAGEQV